MQPKAAAIQVGATNFGVCGGDEKNIPDDDRTSLPQGWAKLRDSDRGTRLIRPWTEYWEGVLGGRYYEGGPYFQYGSAIRFLEGHP